MFIKKKKNWSFFRKKFDYETLTMDKTTCFETFENKIDHFYVLSLLENDYISKITAIPIKYYKIPLE